MGRGGRPDLLRRGPRAARPGLWQPGWLGGARAGLGQGVQRPGMRRLTWGKADKLRLGPAGLRRSRDQFVLGAGARQSGDIGQAMPPIPPGQSGVARLARIVTFADRVE